MSSFSQKQAQETGMAVAFIVLLIAYLKESHQLLPVAIMILGVRKSSVVYSFSGKKYSISFSSGVRPPIPLWGRTPL